MLYATTRNQKETFTAQRALKEQRAPDGGFYIPFRYPVFSQEELDSFKTRPFRENAAELLGLLFGTRLSGFDLEFLIGRQPVSLQKIGRRTLSCERWRNPGWSFEGAVRDLASAIRSEKPEVGEVPYGPWAQVGMGIISLFCVFGMLDGPKEPGQKLDIALSCGELYSAVSAWYARAWGLPIGKIVVGCRDHSGLWDLLHSGEMSTVRPLPAGMEMLICLCGGQREAQRYGEAVAAQKTYVPMDQTYQNLKKGLAVSIISEARIRETIPAAYQTHGYLLSPESALGYAGLLDYRAASGSGGWGMLLCDRGPSLDRQETARSLGVTLRQAEEILHTL